MFSTGTSLTSRVCGENRSCCGSLEHRAFVCGTPGGRQTPCLKMGFQNSSGLTRGEGLYEKREEEGGDLNNNTPRVGGPPWAEVYNFVPKRVIEVLKQVFFITGTSCSVAALS